MRPNLPKKLTEHSIAKLEADERRYEAPDHKVKNLVLRVYPSGKKSWAYRYRFDGKNKRFLIGDGDSITPDKARRKARTVAGEIANKIDPNATKQTERRQARRAREGTLKAFLDQRYEPWVLVERKSGAATMKTLRNGFAFLLHKQMDAITNWEIEKWRKGQHKAGVSPNTTNRKIAALRACLSKAVEWGVIDNHPLQTLKASKVDKNTVIRTIDDAEEKRLRKALRERDAKMRGKRASGNAWRLQRHRDPLPDLDYYVDHLEPIVLLAINTGMRRGEILTLKWTDISQSELTLRAENTKSSQTRTIPLNAEAQQILKRWNSNSEYVFPGPENTALSNIKRSWSGIRKAANLPTVRFHDMRHTFATRLLQRGVDIKTVSTLLGHADIATTAKYLHATDDSKMKAVELL